MKRACVIGWPIEHSRSPVIHTYWLNRYGIDGSYTREAVRPEDLDRFLRALKPQGYAGCNVTVPHKERVIKFVGENDASVLAIGAANTIWLNGERTCAANTDTYGFMTYLDQRTPEWRQVRRPVTILGAGGAARAIVYGFLQAGVNEVRVANRSSERGKALQDHFGNRVQAVDWQDRSRAAEDAAVVVNTTSLGLNGEGNPGVDFSRFHKDTVICDIVYTPLATAFLNDAKEFGLKTVDGLGMLLHQAVPGFEKWFGVRPEVTPELYDRLAAEIEGRPCSSSD